MVKVSNEIKLRSLVSHGAMTFQDGGWVPLARVKTNGRRTPTNMLIAASAAGLTVKCGCGCGAICSYGEIEFDRAQAKLNDGSTTISWIQPLRRECRRAKTRVDLKILRRIRQRLFGDGRPQPKRRCPSRVIASRPLTGRPFQLYAIQGGRG
jgi:hypothetical protein